LPFAVVQVQKNTAVPVQAESCVRTPKDTFE
jgi:hypothetical protein